MDLRNDNNGAKEGGGVSIIRRGRRRLGRILRRWRRRRIRNNGNQ